MIRTGRIALLCVLAIAAATGCGGDEQGTTTRPAVPEQGGASVPGKPASRPAESVAPSHCPADLPACRTTEGRIVYL